MTVDLPWSTTITVDDAAGIDRFSILAINATDAGSLRCNAKWNQADGEGTWGSTGEFIAGCSADVLFEDDGDTVRLDPGAQSVSFAARDEAFAEAAAEAEAEEARVAALGAFLDSTVAPGPVELDGWRIEPTGVNRDATAVLAVESTQNRRTGPHALLVELEVTRLAPDPARVTDIKVGAVGGFELEEYDADNDDCGTQVPNDWLDLEDPELATGESAVFNVCLQVNELEAVLAVAEISVFLGDDPPVLMRLHENGITGSRELSDGAVDFIEYDVGFTLEVIGTSVDDLQELGRRLGEDVRPAREGLSYVMIDVNLTDLDPEGFGPSRPGGTTDWTLVSADGTRVHDWTAYCPGVFDLFTDAPAPEGGIDWNFGDDSLLTAPGETKTFALCFEVDAADVAGSVLELSGIEERVTLATGL